MLDSLNVKFHRLEFNITDTITNIRFFCNFLNNTDNTEKFAYLRSYGSSESLYIGYFVHISGSRNVTFWHPL